MDVSVEADESVYGSLDDDERLVVSSEIDVNVDVIREEDE